MMAGRILLLFALGFACKVQAQRVFTREDSLYIYKLKVDTLTDMDGCTVKLNISAKAGNAHLQIAPDAGNYIRCDDDTADHQCFAIEDMNFDGYNDMRLLIGGIGTGHNLSYNYWLYDPESKTFKPTSIFDELTEPYFNASTETVTSYQWGGQMGSSSTEYELHNGKLRVVAENSSSACDYTGNYLEGRTEYQYVKGKQVMVLDEQESFDEKRKQVVTTTKRRVKGKVVVHVTREKAVKEKY